MTKNRLILYVSIIIFFIFCFILGFVVGKRGNSGIFILKQSPPEKILLKKPILTNISKTQTFTSEGGSITVEDGKGIVSSLAIPQDAVDKPTEITLTILGEPPFQTSNEENILPGVIIGPENLNFIRPAILTFHFSPIISTDALNLPEGSIQERNVSVTLSLNRGVSLQQQRQSGWPLRIRADIPAVVISTDGNPTQSGMRITIIRSDASAANNTMSAPVDGAGTYSPDTEVDSNEAMDQLEQTLLNPNATLDEVFDTAYAASIYDFQGLSTWAKNKLKERTNEKILALAGECLSDTYPISRFELSGWQQIAAKLGWDTEEKQFNDFLDQCKKHYSFKFVDDRSGRGAVAIHTWSFSTCGFIDDPYEGFFKSEYGGIVWGGCQSNQPFHATLAPGGGTTSSVEPGTSGPGNCGPGDAPCTSCYENSVNHELVYDGRLSVSMPYSSGSLTSQISIGTECNVQARPAD